MTYPLTSTFVVNLVHTSHCTSTNTSLLVAQLMLNLTSGSQLLEQLLQVTSFDLGT